MAARSHLPPPQPGHVCVVTGASAGIGVELARVFSQRGYETLLVARRGDRVASLADELRRTGAPSTPFAADLSDAADREKLLAHIADCGLVADVLVNNAGFGTAGLHHELQREREVTQVRVNCEAIVDLTAALAPAMAHRGCGAILNVASTASFQPLLAEAVYSASKAFVLSFTESLHYELRPFGVTVTALCPGPVRTEFQTVSGDPASDVPWFRWRTPRTVARAGFRALERGRRLTVVGLPNRASATVGRYCPRPVLFRLADRRPIRRGVGARDA